MATIVKPEAPTRPRSLGCSPGATATPQKPWVSRYVVLAAASQGLSCSFPVRRAATGGTPQQLGATPSKQAPGTIQQQQHTLESLWQRRRNSAASVCEFSWNIRVSIAAASKLLAAVMAWMSPVMCRFISDMGTICEKPPPAAPPLMPNVGPWDGCRTHVKTRLPQWAPSAWHKPTVVVDFPSPRGVGVIPATTTARQGHDASVAAAAAACL